jgi:hypothetical protein
MIWNPWKRRRAERESLLAEAARLRAERDGFERAYLAVSAERDAARAEAARWQAERDGFEAAWRATAGERDTARAEAAAWRAERDGFEAAWQRTEALCAALRARALPGVLIVTMPKSGTVFCEAALTRTFGLRTHHVCGGRFPADALDPVALGVLGQGGRVAMTHADASPGNLALLAARGQPFVVHLRDPRAAMLSMLHHIRAYHADPALRPYLARIGVAFPAGFHEAPFADQLDSMIAHYLPAVVAWTQGWLAALDADAGLARLALVTRYEALAADSAAFLRALCAHVGLPAEDLPFAEPPRDASAHFRKGDDAEWRRVLSPAQQDAAGAALPPALLQRLGWAAPATGSAPVPA